MKTLILLSLSVFIILSLVENSVGQFEKTRTCDDKNCVECDQNLCRVIWGAGKKSAAGTGTAGTNQAGKKKAANGKAAPKTASGCLAKKNKHNNNNNNKKKGKKSKNDQCLCPEGYEADRRGRSFFAPVRRPAKPAPVLPKECNQFRPVKACSCSRRIIDKRPLPPSPRPPPFPRPPLPPPRPRPEILPTPPPFPPGTNLGPTGSTGPTLGSRGGQSTHVHCSPNGECVRIVCNNGICDGIYVPNPDGRIESGTTVVGEADNFGVGGFNRQTIGGRTYDGNQFVSGSSIDSRAGQFNNNNNRPIYGSSTSGLHTVGNFNSAGNRQGYVIGRTINVGPNPVVGSPARSSVSCSYDYQCPPLDVCHGGWCIRDFKARKHISRQACTVTNGCPPTFECYKNTCWDKTTLKPSAQIQRGLNVQGSQCTSHEECGIQRYCRCQNITPCDVGFCVGRHNIVPNYP